MCGIYLSCDFHDALRGTKVLVHRGQSSNVRSVPLPQSGWVYVGFNRLAIVDTDEPWAEQPFEDGNSVVAFNGELYNRDVLISGMSVDDNPIKPRARTEVAVIDAMMRRFPRHFQRFFDGYFAIVRVDKSNGQITIARDLLGVMPLYYQKHPFAIASERKALGPHPIEVQPGETLVFNSKGKLLRKHRYDPWSLHMEPMNHGHLADLFLRAVDRRLTHSEVPVCLALSGGLDSALVAAAAYRKTQEPLHAITVVIGGDKSDEVMNARAVCKQFKMVHHVVPITKQQVMEDLPNILYYLEDPRFNPIKYAAMIRNYYTAKYAPGTVILCGEGADEIGCGYPPHLARKGIELEWKSFSTVRSMHAINLDRVNKGGMAFTKEFRTPFLDRALILYCMGCKKEPGKPYFRELAKWWDVPQCVLDKPKYSTEENLLWGMLHEWDKNRQHTEDLTRARDLGPCCVANLL